MCQAQNGTNGGHEAFNLCISKLFNHNSHSGLCHSWDDWTGSGKIVRMCKLEIIFYHTGYLEQFQQALLQHPSPYEPW